jgi:hypothetical protein
VPVKILFNRGRLRHMASNWPRSGYYVPGSRVSAVQAPIIKVPVAANWARMALARASGLHVPLSGRHAISMSAVPVSSGGSGSKIRGAQPDER